MNPGHLLSAAISTNINQSASNRDVNEPTPHILVRRSDDGDTVSIKGGLVNVVLARFTSSGTRNEIHYIVHNEPEKGAA